MSEETAAVVAAPSEALTGIEATPIPSTDGAAAVLPTPDAPLSAREFRESLRQRVASRPAEAAPSAEPVAPVDAAASETPSAEPEPVVDATGRAHDPATGKFIPAAENAEAAPATEAVPEGYVRLPVPDGHPLRDRGRESVTVPASEEDYHRWALNEPTRRAELKEARERAVQMEEQVLRMQASEAARRKFEETVDPGTLEAIRAVEEVNPALAALMRRGLESSLPELEQAEFQTLADARVQAEVQSEVEAFVQRTRSVAQAVYADIAEQPYFPALYQKARAAYGAELAAREQAGQYGTQSEQEFLSYMRSFVAAHPDASQVFRQKLSARQDAERQRIAAETAEAERQKHAAAERERLTAAANNRKTNPLGRVAMGVTTGRETVPEVRPGSAYDARRTLRDRMRTGA